MASRSTSSKPFKYAMSSSSAMSFSGSNSSSSSSSLSSSSLSEESVPKSSRSESEESSSRWADLFARRPFLATGAEAERPPDLRLGGIGYNEVVAKDEGAAGS
eukprot:CAMPEP_0182461178 /NCGR_PEP_ID=MMETSP1319-20130603/5822_1 /TAXON_ID=172717 /ORGANISM="Bolidomonas pacifica, Strain RCC208" /LENGTH=102 /DNA_ID=CAMNT_0024660409 /DNA_START=15 /DNA_END=323 /DNA_ORIENTATION=+